VKNLTVERIGPVLAIAGSALSLLGALVNNLFLLHTLAMEFWMISNPLLLAYFIGLDSHWWNGQHLSTRALICLYFLFTISNFYGLWIV
jgi:hypothetical protein